MARKPKTTTIDAPPQASGPDESQPAKRARGRPPKQRGGGANCSDETKRQAYREALVLKIGVESAHEVYKSKQGSYRAYLKAAANKGVPTDAVTNMMKRRFDDPDLVLIEERERLKMYELSGFLPGVLEKISDRYDVQEATANEEEENQVLIAYDRGHLAGRSGHTRDTNPYPPGSLGHVKFTEGWIHGQRAIADEMLPDEEQVAASAPMAPRRSHSNDDSMPGNMPSAVH